jgi:hypothetical protein
MWYRKLNHNTWHLDIQNMGIKVLPRVCFYLYEYIFCHTVDFIKIQRRRELVIAQANHYGLTNAFSRVCDLVFLYFVLVIAFFGWVSGGEGYSRGPFGFVRNKFHKSWYITNNLYLLFKKNRLYIFLSHLLEKTYTKPFTTFFQVHLFHDAFW